jgi:hypothetical protein
MILFIILMYFWVGILITSFMHNKYITMFYDNGKFDIYTYVFCILLWPFTLLIYLVILLEE